MRPPLACAAFLVLACSRSEPGSPAEPAPPRAGMLARPPSIVLVSVDTLRREHLGCYGYFRPTSPHIDAFAREGVVFERALASMASTLPSHLTMLTGLYPHQHGMTSNLRGASAPFLSEPGRLSAAAVLRQCGYATAAFVSAIPLAPSTGIDAGFETYDAPQRHVRHPDPERRTDYARRRAAETNAQVFAWLEEHAGEERPLFLFVHYFDPHEPNDPEPPYASLFATDERQMAWIRSRPIDPAGLTARYRDSERIHRHFIDRKDPESDAIGLEQVADLMNRYDGEVRSVDDAFGALLDRLRALPSWQQSIVVFTADHGQSLGENLWFGHGTVSNLNTFVPLILRLPGGLIAPQRIEALVSLADLMPTVLARFELPGSELLRGQFEGEDVLSGRFSRSHAFAQRALDSPTDGGPGTQCVLLAGRWKYLYRAQGDDELYDLAGTGEFVDVLEQHADVGAQLRGIVLEILARRPALLESEQEIAAPDLELLEGLRELGYGGDK